MMNIHLYNIAVSVSSYNNYYISEASMSPNPNSLNEIHENDKSMFIRLGMKTLTCECEVIYCIIC